jgi:ketosteroid isomerase-like protein
MTRLILCAALAAAVPLAPTLAASAATAQSAAWTDLLAADRAYSQGAKGKDAVAGLSAMFDGEAVMVSGGAAGLIRGPAAIRERLAARPENLTAEVEWQPVGGGISADGTQGYTYGGLTLRPKDGPSVAQKYLAYWIKRPEGWRVFAYKRAGRRETGPLAAAPPVIGTGARSDDAKATLIAAEKAFSDEAQVIGLRAAFRKWGRPDSVNIGAADPIAVGADVIGLGVAGPEPGSPVTWAADEVLVAPSGDMGLSYGLLHAKSPPEGQPATIPFLTVWARPKPGDPWRYVAE